MRRRINVSISPAFYEELNRICISYGFANMCEICTALLSMFIDRVKLAENNRTQKVESNEEMIKTMFSEFENWEPTPQSDIIYRRHNRRHIDTYIKDDHKKNKEECTNTYDENVENNKADNEETDISIYDFAGW